MLIRPLLVDFEGLDAAGKGTQSTLLAKALDGERISFPAYETDVGKAIKALLMAPNPDPLALQAFNLANKYEMADRIRGLLNTRSVVLDRYIFSALTYGWHDGLDPAWLAAIHSRLPVPDIHILIDIPVEVSFERRPIRMDAYESSVERMADVREKYLHWWRFRPGGLSWQGRRQHYLIYDGTRPVEDLHESILHDVKTIAL